MKKLILNLSIISILVTPHISQAYNECRIRGYGGIYLIIYKSGYVRSESFSNQIDADLEFEKLVAEGVCTPPVPVMCEITPVDEYFVVLEDQNQISPLYRNISGAEASLTDLRRINYCL